MKKKKKRTNHKNYNLLLTLVVPLIHAGIIYFSYALSSRFVYDNNIKFSTDRALLVPQEGNFIIFNSILLGFFISYFVTSLVWLVLKKKSLETMRMSVKSFLFVNFIPNIAIITAAYLTLDQLVAIVLYLILLVLLIYFRDY